MKLIVARPRAAQFDSLASWLSSLKASVGVALMAGIAALIAGLAFNKALVATVGAFVVASGAPALILIAALEQIALDLRFRVFEFDGEYERCAIILARVCESLLTEANRAEIQHIFFRYLVDLEKAQEAGQEPLEPYNAAVVALSKYLLS